VKKTTKPIKTFTTKELVRVSDLRQVVGGLEATRQKIILTLE
jgi:hypothetical protein